MHLEIHDVRENGNKLIFKLAYDEEFRTAVASILNKTSATKGDIQRYISDILEKSFDDGSSLD